jgi:hypothetical protein
MATLSKRGGETMSDYYNAQPRGGYYPGDHICLDCGGVKPGYVAGGYKCSCGIYYDDTQDTEQYQLKKKESRRAILTYVRHLEAAERRAKEGKGK